MLVTRKSLPSKISAIYVLTTVCAIIILHRLYTISGTRFLTTPLSQQAQFEGFPKIIWYKLGPKGLNDDTRKWTNSCINANPTYRAEFLTDEAADEYVRKTFESRPDIVDAYVGLQVPILKADLLRYLLLYNQGGIWSDLDVSCETPIDEWISLKYIDKAGLVVGWEFDLGWDQSFVRQFASWTIMAKPASPHMMQVINDILEALKKRMDDHEVSVEDITLAMVGDVVDFSGPRRLTSGIYKSLSQMLNRTVLEDDIAQIVEPKLIGDVLVMPGRSFADSSNRYMAKQEWVLPPPLVTHHYAGSWKNDHGGEEG